MPGAIIATRPSPATGRTIWGGVVPFIDLHLRTLARSGGRAVAGWSMGGYGAIHLVTLAGDMTRRSTHIRCIHPPMLRRMSFERWTL
jgi:hypothetical protein